MLLNTTGPIVQVRSSGKDVLEGAAALSRRHSASRRTFHKAHSGVAPRLKHL